METAISLSIFTHFLFSYLLLLSPTTSLHFSTFQPPATVTVLRPISSLSMPKLPTLKHKPLISALSKPILKGPSHVTCFSSSGDNISTATKPKREPQSAKIIPLIISVPVGLLVLFVVPKPAEVSAQAWQLLAIFPSTIAGLVLSSLPVGDGKAIVIEHCKQCNSFKTRALTVKEGLEKGVAGVKVVVNPEKPRRGCFEILGENVEKFISLLDMKRPFAPIKALDMDKVLESEVAVSILFLAREEIFEQR